MDEKFYNNKYLLLVMERREIERCDNLSVGIAERFPRARADPDIKKFFVPLDRDSVEIKLFKDPFGIYKQIVLSRKLDNNGVVMAYELEADVTIRKERKTNRCWFIIRTEGTAQYSAKYIFDHRQDFPKECFNDFDYLGIKLRTNTKNGGFYSSKTLPIGIDAYAKMKDIYRFTILDDC